MMTAFRALLWKDLRYLFRDPGTAILLIVLPLVIITFTSFAFKEALTGDNRLGLPVVDLDRSPASRELIQQLGAITSLDIQEESWDGDTFTGEDAAHLFKGGERIAVLLIPSGYSAHVANSEHVDLPLFVDPSQQRLASVHQSALSGQLQIQELIKAAVAVTAEQANRPPDQVQPAVVDRLDTALAHPEVAVIEQGVVEGRSIPSAFDQTVPGFTLMFAVFLASSIAGRISLEKNYMGTWHRTLVSPVSRPMVVGSYLVSAFCLGVFQTAILFSIGHFVFGMELGNSIIGLVGIILLFQLFPAALGLFIAGLTDNFFLQNNVVNLTVMLLAVVGGAMIPVFLLPHWMQWFSRLTPHFWALDGLHDLMFRGASVGDVWQDMAALFLFGAIPLTIGLIRFQLARYL